MFGAHDLWLFVLSGLALNVTPGPDTAYIVARSAQMGRRGGIVAALGIGAGCFVHIAAAALGLSALLASSAAAFTAMKLIGAAYLAYLGIRMLFARPAQPAAAAAAPPPARLAAVFRQGFLTNVLNPKVALFFLAFLPQFIDAGAASKPLAFLFLGLIFDLNGTVWNVGVAVLAARALRGIRESGRLHRLIGRTLGAVFLGLGIRLAFAGRG